MQTIESSFAGMKKAKLHCQGCGEFVECGWTGGYWYCIFCYSEQLMSVKP